MAQVIKFPPDLRCPICSLKLRPATRAEIEKGLSEPKLRHFFAQAVQGDTGRTLLVDDVPAWVEYDAVPAAWLMICDKCGHKTLWSKEDEAES